MNIFALDVDGRPTMVFDAASLEEAQGICALPEFRADLGELTAGGAAVCDDGSKLAARAATDTEIAAFRSATATSAASEGPTMVMLVKVDGAVVTVAVPG